MRRALAALVLVIGVGAAGCSAEESIGPLPGPPDVDVDTAELREVKDRIGMAACEPGTGDGPVEGGLPELELPCLGGGEAVDLSTLRGPMVLNLWQSFCEPCKTEMPALEEFHQQHGDEVAVVGLDYNDVQPVDAMALAEQTGVTYPSLADPGGEFGGVEGFGRVAGLPGWIFVDADGAVTHVEYVSVDSVAEIEELVHDHLGVRL